MTELLYLFKILGETRGPSIIFRTVNSFETKNKDFARSLAYIYGLALSLLPFHSQNLITIKG
jgi:hypothetical protein